MPFNETQELISKKKSAAKAMKQIAEFNLRTAASVKKNMLPINDFSTPVSLYLNMKFKAIKTQLIAGTSLKKLFPKNTIRGEQKKSNGIT